MVAVLEIGGTHVTAALVDTDDWRVRGSAARAELDAAGTRDEIVATLVGVAGPLRTGDSRVWGVALPGPFDYAGGIADFHGVGKFDALRGVDLGAVLRAALGTGDIRFVNDAEAFAVGEWVAGAARGHRRAIGVTLGTGVGSAFLVDGVAQHHGPGVAPEGRLDLLEIAGRPLEDTVSRRGIRAGYAALIGQPPAAVPDVRDIADLARGGEPAAVRAVDVAVGALGRVLGPRTIDFEATILVVGGSISKAWDVIGRPLGAGMNETAPDWSNRFAVEPAHDPDEAALVGAAWHATRPH